MTMPSQDIQQRLEAEANMWIATIRPDNRPHLTPVWFAWHDGKLYACIQSNSVKARNLRHNPHVSVALEDGSNAVICEGTAAFLTPPWPEPVAGVFMAKYSWNITTDGEYDSLVEITPAKWLNW
jgi:hypothetical protein